jgi:predicted house-cleaning NTP pyrophosphatase (Maf/HAM1 superfamily)
MTVFMQIVVSSFEETLPHHWFEDAADYAVETARHKALDVAKVCAAQNGKAPVDLIISADTVSTTRNSTHERAAAAAFKQHFGQAGCFAR